MRFACNNKCGHFFSCFQINNKYKNASKIIFNFTYRPNPRTNRSRSRHLSWTIFLQSSWARGHLCPRIKRTSSLSNKKFTIHLPHSKENNKPRPSRTQKNRVKLRPPHRHSIVGSFQTNPNSTFQRIPDNRRTFFRRSSETDQRNPTYHKLCKTKRIQTNLPSKIKPTRSLTRRRNKNLPNRISQTARRILPRKNINNAKIRNKASLNASSHPTKRNLIVIDIWLRIGQKSPNNSCSRRTLHAPPRPTRHRQNSPSTSISIPPPTPLHRRGNGSHFSVLNSRRTSNTHDEQTLPRSPSHGITHCDNRWGSEPQAR